MRVLMISGSRNPEGQTATEAGAFVQGVRNQGGTVEEFYLPGMSIERCRQCEDNGWGICRTQGECVIEDDLAGLVDRIREADGLVFANPVYFSGLCESLRTFLDRLRRIAFHEQGRVGIAGKLAVGICVAGGSGNGAPECGFYLDKALKSARLDVVDMVLARRQNLEMKQSLLVKTGEWFADQDSE